MKFDNSWYEPNSIDNSKNINFGKTWNALADNLRVTDMNRIVSNLQYLKEHLNVATTPSVDWGSILGKIEDQKDLISYIENHGGSGSGGGGTKVFEGGKFVKEFNADTKANLVDMQPLFKDVSYEASTGIITFTKLDGTTKTVDLPLELLIESGKYDTVSKEIVLILANKEEIRIPAQDLIDEYYADDVTLELKDVNGKATFNVKNGGIGTDQIANAAITNEKIATIDGNKIYGIVNRAEYDAAGNKIDTYYLHKGNVPTKLPNPQPLIFKSKEQVLGSYDGAEEISIDLSASEVKPSDIIRKNPPISSTKPVTYIQREIILRGPEGKDIEGSSIWTDGVDIYDYGAILDKKTNTWLPHTWQQGSKYPNKGGDNIWTDGYNIYFSDKEVLSRPLGIDSNPHWDDVIFKWVTSTVDVSMDSVTNFMAHNVWTDGVNIYYNEGERMSYQLDILTKTWKPKVWNISNIYGFNIWTNGTDICYTNENDLLDSYILDNKTKEWVKKVWDWGGISFKFNVEKEMWTDGANVRARDYILDLETETWIKDPSAEAIYKFTQNPGYVWTDGTNTYMSHAGHSYILLSTNGSSKPTLNVRTKPRIDAFVTANTISVLSDRIDNKFDKTGGIVNGNLDVKGNLLQNGQPISFDTSNLVDLTSAQTISGNKTFTGTITASVINLV